MQTYIARCDGIGCESCYHDDAFGEIDGVMTGFEEVRMDVYGRHLEHTHGIGEDRLCLTVFIACGIHFELGRFGPFGVIVVEEAYEESNGLVAGELNCGAHDAGGVAIQDQRLKTDEFWRKTVFWRVTVAA